ncbi:MAG: nuclear transport factor 2 family protein [Acidimicrobiia bacterium]
MSRLPEAVASYFAAHDRHDVDGAVAQFAPDATVVDDGQTYTGVDEIRGWLSKAGRQYTYTRTPLDAVEGDDGGWIVRNRLDGNFPGGTVDLAYRFEFHGGRIAKLVIAP